MGKNIYLYKDGVSTLYETGKRPVERTDSLENGIATYEFLRKYLRAKKLNNQEMYFFLLKKTGKWPDVDFDTITGMTANQKWLKK